MLDSIIKLLSFRWRFFLQKQLYAMSLSSTDPTVADNAQRLCAMSLNRTDPSAADNAQRLNLGCGAKIVQGWLNADIVSTEHSVTGIQEYIRDLFIMDATKPFPFRDGQLDYIYCEDFMEHFMQVDGLSIMAEAFRTLKPGGVWRISTPNFETIVSHLDLSGSKTINRGHWGWGHCLLYSRACLIEILRKCGFSEIKICKYGESEHDALRGMDTRVDQVYLNLIVEATKPLA